MPCICLPLSEINKQERLAACSERSDQASPQVRGGLVGVEKKVLAHASNPPLTAERPFPTIGKGLSAVRGGFEPPVR